MIKKDNSCLGKIKYKTLAEASESAASMNKKKGKRLCAYKCTVCGFNHTGHESKGRKMIDKCKKVDYVHEPGVHKVKNKWED